MLANFKKAREIAACAHQTNKPKHLLSIALLLNDAYTNVHVHVHVHVHVQNPNSEHTHHGDGTEMDEFHYSKHVHVDNDDEYTTHLLSVALVALVLNDDGSLHVLVQSLLGQGVHLLPCLQGLLPQGNLTLLCCLCRGTNTEPISA